VIGDRWGVTDAEVARRYPCDEVVVTPTLQAWRGITVRATADRVWPWVGQIRLAPYAYDWIDNLGHRSPRELRGLPDPGSALTPPLCAGDLVMARRQLRTLARLAETATVGPTPPDDGHRDEGG
jgi:hypothetical protein